MFELDYGEIFFRIILAVLFGSVVGYEREVKGHDAGLRTHILVCVGACIVTLVQLDVTYNTVEMAIKNPDLLQVLNTDMTRMPAQIISGIGFLGAGTIIVTKKKRNWINYSGFYLDNSRVRYSSWDGKLFFSFNELSCYFTRFKSH